MRYIGIEGSSYVGKTTLVENLHRIGHSIIPEYDALGPFPVSDGSYLGARAVVDQLFERERMRTSMLTMHSSDQLIFCDRTPISFVTFEDMKILQSDNAAEQDFHTRIRDYAYEQLMRLAGRGDIYLPERIAVLSLNNETNFQDRVIKRGVTAVGELALFSVQRHIAEQSVVYASTMVGDGSVAAIAVDQMDEEDLVTIIEQFATMGLTT